jgi:hypothetical protein
MLHLKLSSRIQGALPPSSVLNIYIRKCCIACSVPCTSRVCVYEHRTEFLGMCGAVPGVGQQGEQHGCDWHVLPVSWEPLPRWLVALHRQRSLMVQFLQYVGPHWGPVHCLVVLRDDLIWLGVLSLPSGTPNTVYRLPFVQLDYEL